MNNRKTVLLESQREKNYERNTQSIYANYYQLEELFDQNKHLEEVLNYLYAIKLNYMNLEKALGSVYSFSDTFFFMIISQACQKCMQLNLVTELYRRPIESQAEQQPPKRTDASLENAIKANGYLYIDQPDQPRKRS